MTTATDRSARIRANLPVSRAYPAAISEANSQIQEILADLEGEDPEALTRFYAEMIGQLSNRIARAH